MLFTHGIFWFCRRLALQAAEDSSTFRPGAYLEARTLSTGYILQELIGNGSSSKVFKVESTQTPHSS